MSADPRRFSDRGDPRQYLRTARVLVCCPRCADCAVVSGGRVTCLSCGYAKEVPVSGWSGQIAVHAGGRCGGCGRDVHRRGSRSGGPPPSSMPVRCPDCRTVTGLPSRWWPESRADATCYAGLDLWLQTPCGNHVLWAYDAEHLDFLERYVRAFIREREPNRNASLASRLPAWVKNAKNRDLVLSRCATLRARLHEASRHTSDAGRRRVADNDPMR